MSVAKLRALLTQVAADQHISLDEVRSVIDLAAADRRVTVGERLWLEAALAEHRQRFSPDALTALTAFLDRTRVSGD